MLVSDYLSVCLSVASETSTLNLYSADGAAVSHDA